MRVRVVTGRPECGSCRGPWGHCDCARAVPVGSTQLMRFAIGFALLDRSGTPPSKERAHYVAQLLGFEKGKIVDQMRSGTEPKAAARTASLRSAT